MSLDRAIIGTNARHARESIGFSQANVADFLSVDQSLISKFEKGDRALQSDMLERIANLYGYAVADFHRDGGIPKQQLKAAYRSGRITPDDMEVIHDIQRIAVNLFFMTDTIGGEQVEK